MIGIKEEVKSVRQGHDPPTPTRRTIILLSGVAVVHTESCAAAGHRAALQPRSSFLRPDHRREIVNDLETTVACL